MSVRKEAPGKLPADVAAYGENRRFDELFLEDAADVQRVDHHPEVAARREQGQLDRRVIPQVDELTPVDHTAAHSRRRSCLS